MTQSRKHIQKWIAAAMLLGWAGSSLAAIDDPVQLASGKVQSALVLPSGIKVYKGIPYAAPPVGKWRWQPPQPATAWQGVRDATQFGNICIQPAGQGHANLAVMGNSPPMDEDCLYLNIWTPAQSGRDRRPVIVWIHGGDFIEGSGSIPLYDGEALARKGALVLTLNYRLGPFGFFAHQSLSADSENQSSGNYGLLDMIAALRWVKANIEAFGGNHDNVTVMGQGAGAVAITALMTSPLADGLFHKAILESGQWLGDQLEGFPLLAEAERDGALQANEARAVTAAALRNLSTNEVISQLKSPGMNIDGWLLPDTLPAVFALGKQSSVAVLAGSNLQEGSYLPMAIDAASWQEQTREQWGVRSSRMLKFYPAESESQALASAQAAYSDAFSWSMRLLAGYQRRTGSASWVYQFVHQPPSDQNVQALGATHSAELPYVFNNLGKLPLYPDASSPSLARRSETDQILAEQLSSYWSNFAWTGNPNGPELPDWPQYNNMNSPAMLLQDRSHAEAHVESAKWLQYNLRFQKVLEQLAGW